MVVGYCDTETVWKVDKRLFEQTADFINIKGAWCDMGEDNAKARFISEECRFTDNGRFVGKYDTITCLEVLEHLQNPLFFLENIKSMMHKDSRLFLSMPGRMKLLWTEKHFREYTKKEFEKWLLKPLELEIIRSKRIRINQPWHFYFTGLRPLLRLFLNYTRIYEIRRCS